MITSVNNGQVKNTIQLNQKTKARREQGLFVAEGKRMGYGGGYYDTYIEKYDVKNTVALAFDMQIKESIPTEKHDKAMKLIITEKSIIGGKGNEQID